jgi:hypothetical protein
VNDVGKTKKLNLSKGDTNFTFYISGLRSGLDENEPLDNCWCLVGVKVKNQFFDYNELNEMFDFREVANLRDSIDRLLKDEIMEMQYVDFTEPDIEFVLYPKADVRTDKIEGSYTRDWLDEHTWIKIIINLTDTKKAYTREYYVFPLNRNKADKLLAYLNEIIPQLEKQYENRQTRCRYE